MVFCIFPLCKLNIFAADVILHVGRRGSLFYKFFFFFIPCFLYFEGRPVSMAVALPVGSQV